MGLISLYYRILMLGKLALRLRWFKVGTVVEECLLGLSIPVVPTISAMINAAKKPNFTSDNKKP